MATPAWLAMTATGWMMALHLPDFSRATVELFATFLVTGEAVFGGNGDFREFGKLFKMLHVHFQVLFALLEKCCFFIQIEGQLRNS